MLTILHTLHVSSSDITTLNEAMNADTLALHNWCSINELELNPEKTKSMTLMTHQRRRFVHGSLHISIDDKSVDSVDYHKVLGVTIGNNLSWKCHVDNICKKIRPKLFLFRRIKPYLPYSARVKFIRCFILPHIDYCITTWGFCGSAELGRLDRLVCKAMRLALDCPCDTRFSIMSRKDMYKTLNLLPLLYHVQYRTCVLTFKALKGLTPTYIRDLLSFHVVKRHLRSSEMNVLHIPFNRLSLADNMFASKAPVLYNSLPKDIRQCTSLILFKKLCFNFFLGSYLNDE